MLSPKEAVLQWYVWAIKELNMSYDNINNMDLDEFFDFVVVCDKMNNPKDYVPPETLFR